MKIYIDIETIPGPEKPTVEELTKKAPGNLKKEETILRWAEENQEREWRKQALDSMRGRILTIGWSIGDDLSQALIVGQDRIETERDLLQQFQDYLVDLKVTRVYSDWIGHNIRTFDLPWLWRKALQYRLFPLAGMIPRERFDRNVCDTMEIWAADFRDRVSLDEIARFLGLSGKPDGIDGSKVFDLWQEGRLEEIKEYCRDDVDLVRDIYLIVSGRTAPEKTRLQVI